MKQQQNLYEQVRSERNLYSKQLLEAKEDISTMKILFRSMNHDINQMKDEITSKDHALVKEHFDHHKVEKQKTTTRNELTKVRKQIESSQQIQTSQLIEIQKLGAIIQEAEEERQRQKKELNAVVGERDILTAQLVRRGEELEQIYEKIKINRTKLRQGEKAYDNNRNIENGKSISSSQYHQANGASIANGSTVDLDFYDSFLSNLFIIVFVTLSPLILQHTIFQNLFHCLCHVSLSIFNTPNTSPIFNVNNICLEHSYSLLL